MYSPGEPKLREKYPRVAASQVCTQLAIPLFIVGKPGTSKSLAKAVLGDAMTGSRSSSGFFKQLVGSCGRLWRLSGCNLRKKMGICYWPDVSSPRRTGQDVRRIAGKEAVEDIVPILNAGNPPQPKSSRYWPLIFDNARQSGKPRTQHPQFPQNWNKRNLPLCSTKWRT